MRLSLELLWRDPDDDMLELRLSLHSSNQFVTVDFYDYEPSLAKWGEHLIAFPAGIDDEVAFEKGAKGDNSNLWLTIRAFVANGDGATALEIEYEKRGDRLDRQRAHFAVPLEAAAINRLGAALKCWSPTDHTPLVFSDGSLEPA